MALGKPSTSLLKEVRKHKLPNPETKVFCDLVVAGWEKEDAYIFSRLWNSTYSSIMNRQDMDKLLQLPNIANYIDDRMKELAVRKKKAAKEEAKPVIEVTETDIAGELSKETQLTELIRAKKMHPEGSKEWLDIKKMIADITRVKQDEIKDEDDLVHFYVPLQCHQCPLYISQKKRIK